MSEVERDPSTWRVLWLLVTCRSDRLTMTDAIAGCYLVILAVLGLVGAGVAIAGARWLLSHLEWV